MIKYMGTQKILIILLMIAITAGLYFYGTVMLQPQNQQNERAVRAQKNQISQMSQNIEDLRLGIEKFEVQKDKFENLRTLGFFDSQDRLVLREKLNTIQSESGLLSAQYTIRPAINEDNEKAFEAGYKILNTPITFSLSALNDAEIYKFIYLLNYGFSGHVTINKMELSKVVEITPTLLQKIGTGENITIVQATLDINLRTLVPDAEAQAVREQSQGEQF